jgi:membrane-associated phospholipid phosphatase
MEYRQHPSLLIMLGAFSAVSVSLIWSKGQKIDAWVFSRFNSYGRRPVWLDKIVRSITELGSGIVTGSITVIFLVSGKDILAHEFLLGTLLLWLVVELIKALVRRPRPFTKLSGVRIVGKRARGNSFPSGHTSQAFYTAAVIARYFGAGWIISFVVYALAVLVGATRMYLGMHYPRDVLAGAVLGMSWGLVGTIIKSSVFG